MTHPYPVVRHSICTYACSRCGYEWSDEDACLVHCADHPNRCALSAVEDLIVDYDDTPDEFPCGVVLAKLYALLDDWHKTQP